jgi:3-isopropylmalate/(R)-2-methylmalate dehydratase small subunit
MQPFTIVSGAAVPMPAANIDTDVIMPKQFLKGIDRNGLARGVFHDLRFDPNGARKPGFVLNQAGWQDARFLIVGPNFGCGSSREHAVWGMSQLGIRALIGTNFAGIFFDNCARNGLLALEMNDEIVGLLMKLATDPSSNHMTINLPSQTIDTVAQQVIDFEIDTARRNALVQGLDAVGATLQHRDTIARFETAYLTENPWLA